MSELSLIRNRLQQGVWEGVVTGTTVPPKIEVRHLDKIVPGVTVTAEGEDWRIRVPIPADAIADGVQTLLVCDLAGQQILARISLIAGEPLDGDLRAELDLLRAELDLLKRAFRQHCTKTD